MLSVVVLRQSRSFFPLPPALRVGPSLPLAKGRVKVVNQRAKGAKLGKQVPGDKRVPGDKQVLVGKGA